MVSRWVPAPTRRLHPWTSWAGESPTRSTTKRFPAPPPASSIARAADRWVSPLRLARSIAGVLVAAAQEADHVIAHRRQEMQRRRHRDDDLGMSDIVVIALLDHAAMLADARCQAP